jgi:hypothetical protein
MTTPPQHPVSADEGKPEASGAAPRSRQDGVAVRPDLGLIPAIYVPRSPGQTIARTLVQRAGAGARRLVCGWAAGLRRRVPIGETMPDIPAGLRYSTDHLWEPAPTRNAATTRASLTSPTRTVIPGYFRSSAIAQPPMATDEYCRGGS